MKKTILVLAGLALGCNTSQKTVNDAAEKTNVAVNPITIAETITEAELKEHLFIYAGDDFEGRETGQPGQKKAVNYLKAAYEALNIPAAQADGNYFQNVPIEMTKLPIGSITADGTTFSIGDDFLSFTSASGNYNDIVYTGYGVEEGDYSDYANMDVTGKIVLFKAGEPMNEDGTYTLSGTNEPSKWSNASEGVGKKTELAKSKGAKGALFYDEQNYARFKQYYTYMKANASGRMAIKNNEETFSSVLVGTDMAKAILPSIATETASKVISTAISLDLKSDNEEIKTENVVAVLKGSELPDEYLVISSHLDHIGISADGEINNGADDDGSGSVALLEIAEAFKIAADQGNTPKRSIVFLHVTGEEKGLLGSKYYTDVDPIFPLSKTVANLNIDMIGRIDPKREGDRNYIYLIGSDKLSTDLHELSEAVNAKYMNIELDYKYNDENDPNRFYYRSDHYNFAKNNIPIIFYFNGTHADYHRPGDTPDKINYDLLQNRTRLVFHTAWEVANRTQRVVVDKASK